ncbi:MAG: prepilin-type N-terminal cleavage/methylation domain-containing protein [Armatimonadetes bacterium]|nr:prepilin-type N-terminal cleavage/methylation domain-containing protein [Armatimonadota bacterium]
MYHRSQSGFTLIELVIVGAVAAVLVAASLGQYQEFVSNQRLHTWAETIATDLRAGQQVSVSQRRTVVAVFDSNLYTITAESAVIKTGHLPPDITVTDTPQTVIFETLGTTAAASTITLRNQVTNRTRQISVAAATGRVRID